MPRLTNVWTVGRDEYGRTLTVPQDNGCKLHPRCLDCPEPTGCALYEHRHSGRPREHQPVFNRKPTPCPRSQTIRAMLKEWAEAHDGLLSTGLWADWAYQQGYFTNRRRACRAAIDCVRYHRGEWTRSERGFYQLCGDDGDKRLAYVGRFQKQGRA